MILASNDRETEVDVDWEEDLGWKNMCMPTESLYSTSNSVGMPRSKVRKVMRGILGNASCW